MIVFWRLALTYYICAVLFYNRRFFAWRDKHVGASAVVQGLTFLGISAGLCWPYLTLDWRLADLWPLPGWASIGIISLVYVGTNFLFVYRADQTKAYTATFLAHDIAALLALFICAPLHTVYHTGNLMAEPFILFCVGLLVVTKMFSVFIYMVEQDLYGRDYPTIDETFVTMLMRLIFFLIMLLPGWRWVLLFLIWFYACGEAHRIRLIDFSRFALYFSVFGAAAVGFLVRCSWYGC